MVRSCVYLVGTLIVCFWAIMANSEYVKYKDPGLPVQVRVKDLLSKMTLEEKMGQMTEIEQSVASFEVMQNYFIGKLHCKYSWLCLSTLTTCMIDVRYLMARLILILDQCHFFEFESSILKN